jgi:hypothetical protein
MNFEEDIRQHVLQNLRRDPRADRELKSKSARDLLIIYGNWLNRLVSTRPRTVHCSTALAANQLASDPRYAPGLAGIETKLRNGQDVTLHLSKDIRYGYDPDAATGSVPLHRHKDLDLLLNDWGIHHLHLSTEVEADGFVKRDGPLLFAAFRPDDAYFIDIMHHGDWTREHIIEVIVNEWPSAGLIEEMPEVTASAYTPTEEDRMKLRKAGMNVFLQISSKFYRSVSGLALSGISLKTTQWVIQVFNATKWFQKRISDDPKYVVQTISAAGMSAPADPDLHFCFFENGGYGVVERETGFRFRLGN